MTAIQGSNNFQQTFTKVVRGTSTAYESTSNFYKVTKIAHRSFIIAKAIGANVIKAVALFSGTLAVIEGIGFLFNLGKWGVKEERQKMTRTTYIAISKMANMGDEAMDFIGFLEAADLVNLGKFATAAVGTLPVFALLANGFRFIGACFSLAQCRRDQKENTFKRKLVISQKNQWSESDFKLKDYYKAKIEKATELLKKVDKEESDILKNKIVKWEKYTKLSEDDLAKLKMAKVDKYTKKESNLLIERKRTWLQVAIEIFKIAMIVIAVACIASGVMTIPGCIILLALVTICVPSTGLVKSLYENHGPQLHKAKLEFIPAAQSN